MANKKSKYPKYRLKLMNDEFVVCQVQVKDKWWKPWEVLSGHTTFDTALKMYEIMKKLDT